MVSGISKKIRVLIVDDHDLILDGMRTILKRHEGITVVEEASSGEMAIDFCKRLEPDVIVMDVKLPRMDGVDAAKRILSVNGRVKVLVFSADFSNQVIDRALDAGITGFFSKSCGWKNFGEAIEAVYRGERYSREGIAEAEQPGEFSRAQGGDLPHIHGPKFRPRTAALRFLVGKGHHRMV